MKSLILICALVAAMLPGGEAGARTPMNIDQWTKTGGGTLTMDLISYTDENNVRSSGRIMTANPWVGLFVLPSLAITGSLHVQSPFGNSFFNQPDMLGFTAGVRYYRQLYHFYGYIGAELGMLSFSRTGDDVNAKIHASTLNEDTQGFMVTVPAGLLLPLSRSLAIDLGVRVHSIWLSGGARWVESSIGYLGIFLSF
ncbi:MAG: hypothetical protein CVU65_04080 [Deltaproteobacteria bacterium HGW-Deltaproteobacteria-22]|nr:MAG: hypothetical protein CVU65_04080 [Deltaproteobacteria bacterium HGW-Deltaproteobacteria-22]